MLAVLKAGGCFVPLDPKHPGNRMKTVIQDLGQAASNTVLTSSPNAHLFHEIKTAVAVDSLLFDQIPTDPEFIGKKADWKDSSFCGLHLGKLWSPKGHNTGTYGRMYQRSRA